MLASLASQKYKEGSSEMLMIMKEVLTQHWRSTTAYAQTPLSILLTAAAVM